MNHEHGRIVARETEVNQSLGEIDEELDVCFASQKDELARTLIKRKLEAQRFRNFLSRKRSTLEETLTQLKARVGENRASLEAMRQKAELLDQDDVTNLPEDDCTAAFSPVRDEDVEVAFLREKPKRSRS